MPLRVYPNPWAARDRHGHPCAVVPLDMPEGSSAVAFIGAELDVENTRLRTDKAGRPWKGSPGPLLNFQRSDGSLVPQQDRRQITRYKWLGLGLEQLTPEALAARTPVTIPADTKDRYYRALVRSGQLIPADKDTATRARTDWREPVEAMRDAKAAAEDQGELEAAEQPKARKIAKTQQGSTQPGGDAS